MVRAFLERDPAYEGVFFTGVRTTNIFCRPTCPARKPRPENVEFFSTSREALFAGFRPCLRCRPLEGPDQAPEWLAPLLEQVEAEPARRLSSSDLRRMGIVPDRPRRWFKEHHGMTFVAYARARRLGAALERIREGERVVDAAFDHGYESLSGFNDAFQRLLGMPPTRAAGCEIILLSRLATPLGSLLAGATADAICFLEFSDRRMLERQLRTVARRLGAAFAPGRNQLHERLQAELDRYFEHGGHSFETPVTAPGTPFQETVWARLRDIPAGSTTSYGELAGSLGRSTAARAVARAVGDNRIAVVIPCHRVMGGDGSLTGYGGGLWRKRRLLEIEGATVSRGQRSLLGAV
jgi:AraC family transcriptional regulator of adaptative response/methylated-DNA-[protein]-cysteine methyltransferase